jgi:hypothetical protein
MAAMIFLNACAMAGSEAPPSACPPVVDYSRQQQTRLADEVAMLPEDALIIDWLSDYAVLRDQAKACGH